MKKVEFKDIILHEDNDYIIINKPPYISSLEDRNEPVNIFKLAKDYNPETQLCHRLDKETSGVLAVAKTSEAYRNLAIQFENREVTKVYHAIVEGIQVFENKVVDQPILALAHGISKIDKVKGKEALTVFNTLKAYKKHSLIECKPVSGRMHQIRVHLAYLKSPIVGDLQYGGAHLYLSSLKKKFNLKASTEELPLMRRVALHAYSLEFINILRDKKIMIEGPYPKDFHVLVRQLEKYG